MRGVCTDYLVQKHIMALSLTLFVYSLGSYPANHTVKLHHALLGSWVSEPPVSQLMPSHGDA